MSSYIKPYQDSVRFNQFDLQVITCGIFNKKEYFSAKVKNIFPTCSRSNWNLVEIIPCYKITRIDGIFVKKPLANYINVHLLLVSSDIGYKLQTILQTVSQSTSVLVSFIKRFMHSKSRILSTNEGSKLVKYFFIKPGRVIVATACGGPVYYKNPSYSYSQEYEDLPDSFVKEEKPESFIYIREMIWQVDTLRISYGEERTRFNEELKCGLLNESILLKKINGIDVEFDDQNGSSGKICICNRYRKVIDQKNESDTLKIVDNMQIKRNDLSFLYWVNS